MANKEAHAAVSSLIRLIQGGALTTQLQAIEANLSDVIGAEQTAADLRKQVAPLEKQIADLKAQATFSENEYKDRTAQASLSYAALLGKLKEQEDAKQAVIDALNAQAAQLESAVEAAKQELNRRMAEAQKAGAAKQRELEKEYEARKMLLDAEENAARERVEGYKAEMNLLLKRFGG